VFTNILVGLDGSRSSQRALEQAIDLAKAPGVKVTLMTVAPPVATYVTLGGMGIETMSAELDKWAKNVLDEAARTVPPEVTAESVQGRGHPGPEILKELKRGGYDLIVLGTRGRGRTQEGLLGSVNGYIHFHAQVPLLSVPEVVSVTGGIAIPRETRQAVYNAASRCADHRELVVIEGLLLGRCTSRPRLTIGVDGKAAIAMFVSISIAPRSVPPLRPRRG